MTESCISLEPTQNPNFLLLRFALSTKKRNDLFWHCLLSHLRAIADKTNTIMMITAARHSAIKFDGPSLI
jgi:hypothetical protein